MNKTRLFASAMLFAGALYSSAENLIPQEPSSGPNIWCTWATQNGIRGDKADAVKAAVKREVAFEGDQGGGADFARSCINEELVFGKNGWADFWPEIRKDLYLLFDDGWDVPYNTPARDLAAFGSFELDEKKFPSCKGSPAERLRKLNEMCKARGWRGAAVWIAAQAKGETYDKTMSDSELREYWKQRVLWSKEAGVSYWKVDWGVHCASVEFRKMLSELAAQYYPELFVEHAAPSGPMNNIYFEKNGDVAGTGAFHNTDSKILKRIEAVLAFSNVFRTYDTLHPIKSTTTLDRAAYELAAGKKFGSKGYLTVEDNMQLAPGLGAAVGIMRSDAGGNRKDVIKSVMWQRIAPAIPMDGLEVFASKQRLEDSWHFAPGSSWYDKIADKTIKQSAPAIVSRGIANPKVIAKEADAPYVMATLHPNGALAISMSERMNSKTAKVFIPKADVEADIDALGRKIGLFNMSGDAVFKLPADVKKVKVLAQNLAQDEAVDVSNIVKIKDGKLIVPCPAVNYACTKPAKGEWGMPGFVILVREAK